VVWRGRLGRGGGMFGGGIVGGVCFGKSLNYGELHLLIA
jgi:hypothetical protein